MRTVSEMTHHKLKIERRWFDRVVAGEKTAELRYNDRDFQRGDTMRLETAESQEIASALDNKTFDKASVFCTITHVLSDIDGLDAGYVILSFCIGDAE